MWSLLGGGGGGGRAWPLHALRAVDVNALPLRPHLVPDSSLWEAHHLWLTHSAGEREGESERERGRRSESESQSLVQ